MGGGLLAEEHGTVGGEMVIVHSVARIEVHRPGAVVELTVRDDRLLIPVHRVAVVAALYVYMGGHVHQVAHVGGQLSQAVAGYPAPPPGAATFPSGERRGAEGRDGSLPRA